jgi:hypothetical protein
MAPPAPAARAGRDLPARCAVAVLGGGMAGMATALRLQASCLSTVVLEAHGQVGGCAGYFRRRGFSFDVGTTTLVDFETGGVGAELLDAVGLPALDGEPLPGYAAWLPDRVVRLHRDQAAWPAERLRTLGDSGRHRDFGRCWIGWPRRSGRPADQACGCRSAARRTRCTTCARWRRATLPLGRHLGRTLGDALRQCQLRDEAPLVGLLSMLVEDTVHSSVEEAPLINAALGVTIRGAGLTRHRGGMRCWFWRTPPRALPVARRPAAGRLPRGAADRARRGVSRGRPGAAATARIAASTPVATRLRPYLDRDEPDLGGAVVVFLGVPDDEADGQRLTHHQLLQVTRARSAAATCSSRGPPRETSRCPARPLGCDDLDPCRAGGLGGPGRGGVPSPQA